MHKTIFWSTKVQRYLITKCLFLFPYQFGNPKIYLGKAEFADIFSGMFFSHIWNKFSGKSQDALMSVYHIRERLVCSEKKGNISISQKFAGDKKIIPAIIKVPLMAGRFLLLSSLVERFTQPHAVRMGFDKSITSCSWAVRLNYLLKESKTGRNVSHLGTDIAWVISSFYQEAIQQWLL